DTPVAAASAALDPAWPTMLPPPLRQAGCGSSAQSDQPPNAASTTRNPGHTAADHARSPNGTPVVPGAASDCADGPLPDGSAAHSDPPPPAMPRRASGRSSCG